MSNLDGRYKLVRWHFKNTSDGWQQKGIERYATKLAALGAYQRARTEDGAWPDLIDTDSGECIK